MVDKPASDGGPERETERWRNAKERDREPDTAGRCNRTECGEHHPGVPELETDQEQRESRLPSVLREQEPGEYDRLDECAARDDRDASVALGPYTPERDQRQTEQEEGRVQVAGPSRHLRRWHLHGPQI